MELNLLKQIDESVSLNEEERLLVDSVSSMARERIAPRAAQIDAEGQFPWENVKDINALGLNAVFIPEQYGGAGMSYSAYLRCVQEISKACASTGIIWATNFHAIKPLIDLGTEEQKEKYLPLMLAGGLASLCITEPDAGSDAGAMRTRFTDDGDNIVINGTKCFITNGDVADLFLLFGSWDSLPRGKGSLSVLIVEKGTPGLSVTGKEDKMGHRGSSTVRLSFDNCRVSRSQLIGEPGQGLKILLSSLNKSRPSIAAHALGIARAAMEDAVKYANERKQFGQLILGFQGIQFMFADLVSELVQAETWLWHVARMVEANDPNMGVAASIAKLKATDLAMKITIEALQIHGGYGYCKDYRIERLMRDAKITQIWEGTNQIHRQIIGKSLIIR
jgi:acyl-CoA dehydrogenase